MSLTTRVGLLAGATALTLTGVGAAASTDASNEQLRAQVEQLSARLAELEGRDENWLDEQRADEIRGLVNDVLADADTRSSLLGSGMASGYDNGFTVGSTDGNFLLRMNGQLQVRWLYNMMDEDGGDAHRYGFENTRTKLWFSGHVVNPDWTYVIEGGFDRDGGDFDLLDAYLSYNYGDGLSVTAGQFKLPLLREQLVDARHLQTVERSLVHEIFTGGRSQGLMLGFEQDNWRMWAAFSDGAGGANSTWDTYDTEWALTGRGEWLVNGNWGQFDEFRSAPGEETGVLIGFAGHWQNEEYGTANADEAELLRLTVDGSVKLGGIGLYGAYIFNYMDNGDNTTDHGLVLQGGYHLTDEWEVFGRFEHVSWDSDSAFDEDVNILTAGVNRYFANHQAKFTADLGYSFDELEMGSSRAGWRADGADEDGQVVLRTQIQLLY